MIKVPMICVNPVYSVEDKIVGTEYLDAQIYVEECDDPIEYWLTEVTSIINKRKSIILYRQDVRAFADKVGGKDAFREIKIKLRERYLVLKLKYNPRTQEFCGMKTAFIIHKR